MSVYDLYQYYLNQAKQQEAASLVNPTVQQVILPQQSGEDGGGITGIGAFGNLDPNSMQMMNIDVYDPNQGFRTQSVPTYTNLSSGLRQTMEGKNVNPMFSNTGATFGLAGLIGKALGFTPDPVGGFVPGSIRGRYDTIGDFFSGNRVGSVPASVFGMEDPASMGSGFGAGGVDMSALHDDFGFTSSGGGGYSGGGGGRDSGGGDSSGGSSSSDGGSTDTCGSFRDGGYVALEINPKNFK